ncbi:MAG: class I SAM-dependent methyltransferase [Ignavibacteria bacterium]|nr:class I SAM-dependent methyltransferase [Ignavibacteria bacterium]
MSNKTTVFKKEVITSKHKFGLLLVSLSVLMLEFTLIRVLSVSLWYHFAFMIISIALLGLGISGVTILISDRINKSEINGFLNITSLLYAVSIIVSFIAINKIPFDPFSLLTDSSQFLYLPVYYVLITLPFFLAGLIIGQLFTRFKQSINKLYFYDLIGAGLGCFAFILVLPVFGGSGGIAAASIIACIATLIFAMQKNRRQSIALFGSIIMLLLNGIFLSNPDSYLPISISSNKVYGNYIKENPDLRLQTRWNSFSKVDIMKDDGENVDDYPVYTAIIDAGNSTTNIPKVPNILDTSARPPFDASMLAMILKRDDTAKVFVLGSGGGGEILTALTNNAKSVHAVEINGILNDLVEKDLAGFWTGGIANDKRVKIFTDDARGWLRGKRIKYDVIISAHTISASATNSGAMSLVENYILTEEALREYLQHLDINGILYITRPEPQMPRLVTSIKIAQQLNGGSDLKNQFYVFKRPPSDFEKDVSFLSGVLYKKSGFDEFDIQRLKTMSALLNLETIYDPVSKPDGIFKDIIESDNIYETVKKYPDIKLLPATDDNPYFEHTTDFTDIGLGSIKESFSQSDRAMITMIQKPVAESTLIVLMLQTVLISALLIFLPIYLKSRKDKEAKKIKKGKYITYFALLGLGYIIIEICLIQRFTLFLGQPVYTMLTVISTMLLFSGIGSMYSEKILTIFKNKPLPVFVIIAALTLLIGLLSPALFSSLARLEILWRVVISVVLIAPLAFFMGIPFPYGMSRITNNTKYLVAYGWGVNGFFSVMGSVLVVMLSMSYGFSVVFILSACLYIAAMLVAGKFTEGSNVTSTAKA